jgi:hypothetical protein
MTTMKAYKWRIMDWNDVTQEQWNTYRMIQNSGITNMFAINTVIDLSDDVLNKESCLAIMENYGKLKEKFG